jgi:Icc-related predicted phosphoesterase
MKIEATNKSTNAVDGTFTIDELHKKFDVSKSKIRLAKNNGTDLVCNNGMILTLKLIGNDYTRGNKKLNPAEKIEQLVDRRSRLQTLVEQYQKEIETFNDEIRAERMNTKKQIEDELSEHESKVRMCREKLENIEKLIA